MALFRLHKTPNKLGDCGGNKFDNIELSCERCQLSDNFVKVVKIYFQFRNIHWSYIMIWCEKSPWIFTSLCSRHQTWRFHLHLMHFIEKVAKISILCTPTHNLITPNNYKFYFWSSSIISYFYSRLYMCNHGVIIKKN